MGKLLNNAPESQTFRLNDGRELKSLHELVSALKEMPDDVFNSHVTADRNDFANWIEGVFQDKELAARIKWASGKEKMAGIVLEALEKAEESKKIRDTDKEGEKARLVNRLKERLKPSPEKLPQEQMVEAKQPQMPLPPEERKPDTNMIEFDEKQLEEAEEHHHKLEMAATGEIVVPESGMMKHFIMGLAAGAVVAILGALAYTIILMK